MEVGLGVGCMHDTQQLNMCSIFKVQKYARKIFSHHTLQYTYRTLQFIVFLTLGHLNKTSNRAGTHTSYTTYKMHENRCVLLESDMHVRPMRFTVLCTTTDSSDKSKLICSAILLFLFASQSASSASKLNHSTMYKNKSKFINFCRDTAKRDQCCFENTLKTRLGICIYKTSPPHRPDAEKFTTR